MRRARGSRGRGDALATLALVAAFGACKSSSSGVPVHFHGEVAPFMGLSVDTGPEPGPGSATIDLTVTGSGLAVADAVAAVEGPDFDGLSGTGVYTVNAAFALAGRVHATSSAGMYDEAVPGLSSLVIPFTGSVVFDPFLTGPGQTATVTTAIAPAMLGNVPLGMGPGQLSLSVADGSVLVSTLASGCVTLMGGTAHYVAQTVTSGTLVLGGTLTVGAPYDQTVDLTNLTIPIPGNTAIMDLGTEPAAGVPDGVLGVCPSDVDASVGDAGARDASADTTDAPAFSISATVNGVTLTPSKVMAFSDPANCGAGGYSVSLFFTGPGLGPNTRFGMCLASVMSGCTMTQGIEYQPDDGTGATYNDDGSSTCGLTVSTLPPGNIMGTFDGPLTNYSVPTQITVALGFNTPLTQ